jgi:type II secretory pathway pseudopilin PulG
MKLITQKLQTNEEGFSLIELLVAMIVGLVVLGIAVIALVATNSASLRVLAKSEAQQNTRQAISSLFTEASDAESLPVCRIAVDAAKQALLTNNTALPAPLEGLPGSSFSTDDCLEISSSGLVVAYAGRNRVCYFKTPERPDSGSLVSYLELRPSISCVTRGNVALSSIAASPQGASSLSYLGGNCMTRDLGRSSHEIYVYQCEATSGNLINWPQAFNFDSSSLRLIADLGAPPAGTPQQDLFTYVTRDSSNWTYGAQPTRQRFKDIFALDVNLESYYDPKTGDSTERRQYVFNQQIFLRGSELFTEESSNE